MKAIKILLPLLFFALAGHAQVNFDTLTPNTWAQIATTGQYPTYAVETHLAFDTSGYAYMLGSCAYGGAAGGTHNNDIFRFQIKTGASVKVFTCGTDPWPGGCQGGQVFDPNRNCIWFGPGNNATCRTGVLWFPGQNYYGGLYRMACPNGPLEKIRDAGLSGGYYLFDPANDLVISATMDNWFGCLISIYNIAKDSVYQKHAPAPFSNIVTDPWHYTCCFDTKRSLVVVAQMSKLQDLWFYNTTTQVWSHKTPNMNPPPTNVPLVYEPLLDKYVLVGTDTLGTRGLGDWHPQVWVYDYDANTWSARPRGNMHYDTLNAMNSTWPCMRTYPGSFGFDARNGVIANWGGYPTGNCGDFSGMKDCAKMNIWAFKLGAAGGTGVSEPRPKSIMSFNPSGLSIYPNPFKTSVAFSLSGPFKNGAELKVFDLSGRQVADLSSAAGSGKAAWNAAGRPAGVYLIRVQKGGQSLIQRIVLAD